jgi:hypothetical protein
MARDGFPNAQSVFRPSAISDQGAADGPATSAMFDCLSLSGLWWAFDVSDSFTAAWDTRVPGLLAWQLLALVVYHDMGWVDAFDAGCGPAAMTNAIRWLAAHSECLDLCGEALPDTNRSLAELMGWDATHGISSKGLVTGTLKYAQLAEHQLPLAISYQADGIYSAIGKGRMLGEDSVQQGSMTAHRVGGPNPPTWDFIVDEMSRGHSLVIQVCWFDDNWVKDNAHFLTIAGAFQCGDHRELLTVDDSDQGTPSQRGRYEWHDVTFEPIVNLTVNGELLWTRREKSGVYPWGWVKTRDVGIPQLGVSWTETERLSWYMQLSRRSFTRPHNLITSVYSLSVDRDAVRGGDCTECPLDLPDIPLTLWQMRPRLDWMDTISD